MFNWSLKLQENNERKTPLLLNYVCFQMPKKRLQAWSYLIFEWEITLLLHGGPFLTMFYTIDSSPLSVTNKVYANNYFEQLPRERGRQKIVLFLGEVACSRMLTHAHAWQLHARTYMTWKKVTSCILKTRDFNDTIFWRSRSRGTCC